MNEECTKQNIKFALDLNNLPEMSKEELERLKTMTDNDVEASALSDPDNLPCTNGELSQFRKAVDVKRIRKSLHMTQQQFAKTFRLSLGSVRDWEQYRSQPDQATKTLLIVIERNPKAVKKALKEESKKLQLS